MSKLPEYSLQRARFLAEVKKHDAILTAWPHPLSGPAGEPLFTDVALIGDAQATRMMVIISGTHGVEGFYGSESQIAWLSQLETLPDDCAVLLIHLLNPWGTAHLRRVNEDNIDLNRNFVDFSQPLPANTDYQGWHAIYHGERLNADQQLEAALSTAGWPAVKRVVEAGQYDQADGFFYGGQQPSWSYCTMQAIISHHLTAAKTIISFDLHTGAGAWGHPMLLSIAQQPVAAHHWGKAIFAEWLTLLYTGAGRDSETGITATATGYLSQFLLTSLPHSQILPLVIECGTLPGEEMHRRVREDHWLHLNSDPASEQGQVIKADLLAGFWPDDPDWRALVAFRTQQIFQRGWRALTDADFSQSRP